MVDTKKLMIVLFFLLLFGIIVYAELSVSNVVLVSTSGNNLSIDNLSVSFTSGNNYNVTDWRKEGVSIAVLNMPFELSDSTTTVKDYTTFENNGNVTGHLPTWSSSGKIGGCYDFDGTDDYIQLPSMPSIEEPTAITVSAWIKTSTQGSDRIIESRETSSPNNGWTLWIDDNPVGQINFFVDTDLGSVNGIVSEDITDDEWHHVVGTWDGTTVNAYVDGSVGTPGSIGGTITNAQNPRIGVGTQATSLFYTGLVDEFKIYNYSLSPEQINVSYQAGLANHSLQTIVSEETVKGDNWTVSVTPVNSTYSGIAVISNVLTIKNSPPSIPTQNSPVNDSNIDINFTLLNCSGSIDEDGDAIVYYYFGDNSTGETLLGVNDTSTAYNWTGLITGQTYYWKCLANAGIYNSSNTSIWQFNYTGDSPIMNTVNILPVIVSFTDDLLGYCNASDVDGNNLSYYYEWYKNGVLNVSGYNNNSGDGFTQNIKYNINNLSSSLTSETENWTFNCRANDGLLNSSWLNTSIIIGPIITDPTQNSPLNSSSVDTSVYTLLNCSGSVNTLGNPLTYYYYGSKDSTNLVLLGTNNTGTALNYTLDLSVTDTYYWYCLAGDGNYNSSNSSVWNFKDDGMFTYAVLDVVNNSASSSIDNVFKQAIVYNYYGVYNRSYFTYSSPPYGSGLPSNDGIDVHISYYDLDTNTMGGDYILPNALEHVIDTHRMGVISSDDSGNILVCYEKLYGTGSNQHNSPMMFYKSNSPETITDAATWSGVEVGSHTSYPHLAWKSNFGDNGKFVFTARFGYSSSDHSRIIYYESENGINWTPLIAGYDGVGRIIVDVDDGTNVWAYHHFPAQSKTDPLVIGINPNFKTLPYSNYNRDYYIKSYDGGNWSNMNGSFIKDVDVDGAVTFDELEAYCNIVNYSATTNQPLMRGFSTGSDDKLYTSWTLINSTGGVLDYYIKYFNGTAWGEDINISKIFSTPPGSSSEFSESLYVGTRAFFEIPDSNAIDIITSSLDIINEVEGDNSTMKVQRWRTDNSFTDFTLMAESKLNNRLNWIIPTFNWRDYISNDWTFLVGWEESYGAGLNLTMYKFMEIINSCIYSGSGDWIITNNCNATINTDVLGNEFTLTSGYTFYTAFNITNMSKVTVNGGRLTISGARFGVKG